MRHQRDTQLPKGIPNHIYSFPEQYGAEDCGNYFVTTVEWGELGHWGELGQNFSESSLCYCSLRDTGVKWDRNLVHRDPCDCLLMLV